MWENMFLRKFQASWPRKSQDVLLAMMKCILQFIFLRFPILKASFWWRVSISDTVDAQTNPASVGSFNALIFGQAKIYQKENPGFQPPQGSTVFVEHLNHELMGYLQEMKSS